MAEQGLKDKTVRGIGWSAIDNVSSHIVSFVVSIVLARLLSPDDYGLLGLIGIFTAISATITTAGFGNALIRKKSPTEDDYNTVFIFNLVVSMVLYGILFLCAPSISRFFDREELVALTRVSSVSIIIGAMALTQRVKLTKRIDFKTQTQITLIAAVSSGIIGIIMAILGFGVWALVAQHLSSSLIGMICLWLFNHWIPQFYFSKTSFKELFGYSWKILLSRLLDTVWKELYQVVVGKFYSPANLGQYTRAKSFSVLLSSNLTEVVQRVTFPVLSEIQDDRARMIAAYRKMIKVTMFITSICMFFLGAVAQPLLYCLIGEKWHEASTYLPLICVSMSLYPLNAINLNMLQVQGRSDVFLILEIVKKVIGIAPLMVCVFVGIREMLIVSVFTGIIGFFLNSYYTGKSLGYTSWMQLKDVAPSYEIALVTALSVYFFKYLPLSHFIVLPIQLIVGAVVVLLICKMTHFQEYEEVKGMMMSYLSKLNRRMDCF